ncbi:MAG TPA: hypothetical protein VEQ63_00940 [Bryobacteraceae bacterium]|nr:hypothetical protein [Bryobacteraceae bacterium]
MEKRSRGTAGGSPERSESRKRRLAAVRREIFIYLFALIAFAVIALAITREAI